MSKIGKKPIIILQGVDLKIDNRKVIVKGPKGELSYSLLDGVNVERKNDELIVSVDSLDKSNLRGLTKVLIDNMIEGVTKEFEKKLMVFGVGYNAILQGKKIVLSLGLSHKVDFLIPEGLNISVDPDSKGNSIITLRGIDKQKIGETAAKLKALKKPEPYKGKGIRYLNEEIKLKPGKTAKK